MSSLLILLGISVIGFLFSMLLAPMETLGWWSGFYNKKDRVALPELKPGSSQHLAEHYVIFLDGIAKASRDNYDDVQLFLDRLSASLPNSVVIGNVLPYSVTNRPLTSTRPLARFWRMAKERKIDNYKDPLGFSINIHNLFQVLVSADSRYGPIYNFGVARLIIEALLKKGYHAGSGIPITLIGYSGGAQVAAGAAPYLKNLLRAPIDLISLAGVISADAGLYDLRFLYHLVGSKDSVEKYLTMIFPGRWPLFANSSWQRGKRKGKFTLVPMGPIGHNGDGSYLDHTQHLENGKKFLDHTLDTVRYIIQHPEEVRAKRVERGHLRYVFELPQESRETVEGMWA
jgi:hypothetical protein